MGAYVLSPASVDGVCGGSHARGLHSRATTDAWLSKVRRRSTVTLRTHIKYAIGRLTLATDMMTSEMTPLAI